MINTRWVRGLTFLLAAAIVGAATACSGLNPGGVRVKIGEQTVAPDQVDRMPVLVIGAMAARRDGQVYVSGLVDDRATDEFVSPIYRKSPGGEWEEVVRDPDLGLQFRRRPGTSEVYASGCKSPLEHGQLRLYRVTEEAGLIDVSDDYWGGLSPEVLTNLGITDCLASWAIQPDGAVLLATPSTLWRVAGGHVEVVVDNLPAAFGTQDNLVPVNPIAGQPEIRTGERGEILLFLTGVLHDLAPLQPMAFRVAGAQVEPISLGADYKIEDAAYGPDGAEYLIVRRQEGDDLMYRGIRVLEEEQSEFLRGILKGPDRVQGISIDVEGRLYLAYGTTGNMFASSKWWLLGFPTEEIISGSTPN